MLQRIREFFENGVASANRPAISDEEAIQRATAALLIEMARQDETVADEELATIAAVIRRKFGLSEQETHDLIELAGEELHQSTDYYQFTTLIKERFSMPQKIRMIENLWEVAFADGRIDRYEEHMVRKIAELLYVPHAAFIAAKLRVAERTR